MKRENEREREREREGERGEIKACGFRKAKFRAKTEGPFARPVSKWG